MRIGLLGIGKMGEGLVTRVRGAGIEVLAWNRSGHPLANVESPQALVAGLTAGARIIWLMLPAGQVVEEMLDSLLPSLAQGDIVIDGGNSNYQDTLRRAKLAEAQGVHYVDVGVSGGPSGAKEGACLMIGGENRIVEQLTPLWTALAAERAYQHLGRVGAGHFAKMVHNGIEYGMMQAIAEGAAVLEKSEFGFDLAQVFDLYNHRSVIESRLVEWTREALEEDPELAATLSKIEHTGEGAWTLEAAQKLGVEAPVIEAALAVRKQSTLESGRFRDKVVSAMRGKFGGHKVKQA